MGDVIDRVITGHVLFLQEEGRMAFPFGEDGDQHIGAGHLVPARRLDVDHGALDHALETGGRLGVVAMLDDQAAQFVVEIGFEVLFQKRDIDIARLHHAGGVAVIGQRQEQMLQGRIFMFALVGVSNRAVEGLFQIARERRQGGPLNLFPWYIEGDADVGGPRRSPGRPWFRPLHR